MSTKDIVRRWKSELTNASDNPAGMVELTQLDEITGGQVSNVASCTCTCCMNCSVQASSCCGTNGCS
jgi:hypothetical protein